MGNRRKSYRPKVSAISHQTSPKMVFSRMVIHQSVLEDKSTRSELTIRNLCQGDVGRGMVYAQNIHNTIQCQFSVLSQVSNEEPAPVTDFRFNLKNRVSKGTASSS